MTASDGTRRLANRISLATLAFLLVYVPAETYVTLSIAGPPGLLHSGYIMNVVGMGLMFWGAATARRFEPAGPALLAIGWRAMHYESGAHRSKGVALLGFLVASNVAGLLAWL